MENLSEIIITGIAGIILGFLIGVILFKKVKLFEWLNKKKLNKVVGNPQVLKKKLEENGEIYDRGEKIHVGIITSGGKEFLDIKRDPKAKEEMPKPKKKKKAKKKKELNNSEEEKMIESIEDQGDIELEDLEEPEEEIQEIPEIDTDEEGALEEISKEEQDPEEEITEEGPEEDM